MESRRVVLMGDSITEMWRVERPEFFDTYGFINRGISDQVTGEMLPAMWSWKGYCCKL